MKHTAIAAMLGTVFAVTGCAVKPVAIDDATHHQRALDDQRKLYEEQEALTQPLTLPDALARAFKYNMDYRTRLMEEAAAMGQTEVANYDMLPRLTAQAGYSWRDNDSFGFGFTPNGTISTTPSAAVERERHTNSLTFAWNLLDFGLSYYRAKQLADQSLIAEERRRKAQQNLVQEVRMAWWRAEAAQRLLPEIDALLDEVGQAADRARLIETRKLLPPLQIVAYRRSLLDLTQQLALRRQELEQARLDLSQLINIRPGVEFRVQSVDAEQYELPQLTAHVGMLESLALENRPELREEAYRARITDLEGRRQLIALLPSLGFDAGTNYDSNRYLLNNRWASASANVTFNLFKAFSYPAVKEANQAAARVDETRRLAVTAAVLAQTRLATVRYNLLSEELTVWDDAVQDDVRIVGYLNAAKQVGLETELELIRAKARHMISKVNRDLVHANVQGAIGRLYNSVGIDVLPILMETNSTTALAKELQQRIEKWDGETFTARPAAPQLPVEVAEIRGLTGAGRDAFSTAMQRILRLSKVSVAAPGSAAPYRIETEIKLLPPETSGQQARMKIRLLDDKGNILSEAEQASMLVTPVSDDQWRAMGEGAGYRMVTPLRTHLASRRGEGMTRAPFVAVRAEAGPTAANLLQSADSLKLNLSGTLDAAQGKNK